MQSKKRTRKIKIVIPLLLFGCFAGLAFWGLSFFPQVTADSSFQLNRIMYYFIFIGLWLSAASLLNFILRIFFWDRFLTRSVKGQVPQLLIDVVSVIIYLIAITIIIGGVFKQPLTGFWATSSVVALILGLALRNMILDFFTGLAINIEQPYKIGDWVTIHQRNQEQNITGQIMEINWRATHIRTENNNDVIIPNNQMSLFIVTNYWKNESMMRDEVEFCLDFSVPTQRARRILLAGVKALVSSSEILADPQPDVLIKETNDVGVVYRVRYWIKPWQKKSPGKYQDAVMSSILEQLSRAGLTLAYPKEDVYYEKLPHRQLDSSSFQDRCELLKRIDLFNSLDSTEIQMLAGQMQQVAFLAEEEIIKQGENGESMYILLEGLLEVYVKNSDEDAPVKVAALLPGQFFGEMSLLTGEPRLATVKAVTDGILYEISKQHLQLLFKNRPEIMHNMSKVMVTRKMSNIKKIEELNRLEEVSLEKSTQNFLQKITSFFKGYSN